MAERADRLAKMVMTTGMPKDTAHRWQFRKEKGVIAFIPQRIAAGFFVRLHRLWPPPIIGEGRG